MRAGAYAHLIGGPALTSVLLNLEQADGEAAPAPDDLELVDTQTVAGDITLTVEAGDLVVWSSNQRISGTAVAPVPVTSGTATVTPSAYASGRYDTNGTSDGAASIYSFEVTAGGSLTIEAPSSGYTSAAAQFRSSLGDLSPAQFVADTTANAGASFALTFGSTTTGPVVVMLSGGGAATVDPCISFTSSPTPTLKALHYDVTVSSYRRTIECWYTGNIESIDDVDGTLDSNVVTAGGRYVVALELAVT